MLTLQNVNSIPEYPSIEVRALRQAAMIAMVTASDPCRH